MEYKILNFECNKGKDRVTLDLRSKQIRVLMDYTKMGEIKFISLSNDDVEGYNYLYEYGDEIKTFYKTLREDILSFTGIKITGLKELKK